MTKKLRTELAHSIADLGRDVHLLEDIVRAIDQRLDGIVARIEWMQIEAARARGEYPIQAPSDTTGMTTERAWATPAPGPLRRFLNGSWLQRDGNTYPRFDTTRRQGPLGGYESYVRRSPPATD